MAGLSVSIKFYLRYYIGHGGQLRFQKPATANSQALCTTPLSDDDQTYIDNVIGNPGRWRFVR